MLETILDALIDSAKTLPFLLVIYFFIEFLESNQKAKYKTVKLLNGKFAPLVASGVGFIPQCGFSVMATDLYCQNYLKLGTLIAFFVATSDEALPILLTNEQTLGDWQVWVAFAIKLVYAVVLGFVINLFDESAALRNESDGEFSSSAEMDGNEENSRAVRHDCEARSHGQTKWQRFWHFSKHPLLHTLKLFLYIFVVNAVFGLIMLYAEQSITDFAANLGFFQCFITAAVGLVPNCASSVIICGMKTQGVIGVSAMLAGLVSNSGIAFAILFRQKKWKRNLGIVALMYLVGVLLGVVCYPFLD